MTHTTEPTWLHGHAHDPNPTPPSSRTHFLLQAPGSTLQLLDVFDLLTLPIVHVNNCFIVSTGHGMSGPFTFAGVRLADLLAARLPANLSWQTVDVISADGFGTRLLAHELDPTIARPILLSYAIDGAPMTRSQGLLRLIVPSETDDALRQVKWVARIDVKA